MTSAAALAGTLAGTSQITHPTRRKDAMKNGQSSSTGFQVKSTQMIVGAVLIGAGGLIGLAGLIVGGTGMVSATRQWFRELEIPPSQVVKQKWDQTKAATVAGATAWHGNGTQANRARV
jgi:hypothetical protein